MKVIIDDPNKRLAGNPEEELPKGTSIRFEVGDLKFRVRLSEDGIVINKTNLTGASWEQISILPTASNKIHIK